MIHAAGIIWDKGTFPDFGQQVEFTNIYSCEKYHGLKVILTLHSLLKRQVFQELLGHRDEHLIWNDRHYLYFLFSEK